MAQLQLQVDEKQKSEEKLQKKIESQRAALKEWEKNSKKVYKEIKHNEIMQEKERYELLLKIKELKHCRLSMFAWLGCIMQGLATQEGPIANWQAHVADPVHANVLTNAASGFGFY